MMLFGWNKVPPALHFFTTLHGGALARWFLPSGSCSNSWMQTPQGFTTENGHLILQDWLARDYL
ncbi:cytochrome ubiquinol oxidase subunit I [Klebsiella pneumoniae]|nr:cytochrome ubiquinol oxidase subunit I [Klebsiella pneumoniae]